MNKEMRNASNQMTEAEKEMQKLEKAGKTYTAAYQEAKATVESVKNEIADYKTKIEANTKAIAENEKQTAEIIKTMKLEDMTMSQLRQHAADLQKQMNNTSQSLSPEAYKALESELNKVKDRMGVVNNANKTEPRTFENLE